MTYMQDAPFVIQVEPVQGCNLGCSFCGIHHIGYGFKKRGFDYMELETARDLADQIRTLGWNPRIEFAMHGEPSLHPELHLMIAAFREALPKGYILVTSNGGGFLKDPTGRAMELFDAGLNTLALDDYESARIVRRVLAGAVLPGVNIVNYPEDGLEWSPHTRRTGKHLVIVKDISTSETGTHATLNNHAGSAAPMTDAHQHKRCAKPFREMSVRWDGSVAICCNDWPGQYKCGNVREDGLFEVWHSPEMVSARRALYHGRRDLINPCAGCDALSYRVGFLPDKKGQQTLPEPTSQDQQVMDKASSGEPYTSTVRPYLENLL